MTVTAFDERHLDAETAPLVRAAQSLAGVHAADAPLPQPHVRALVNARGVERGDALFMRYFDDDVHETAEYGYAAFARAVRRTAWVLHHDLGLRRGDAVGTLAVNRPETVVLYFAAWWLGLTVAPQNVDEDDDRIAFSLDNAECRALFVLPAYAERARALHVPQVRAFVLLRDGDGPAPAGFASLAALTAVAPAAADDGPNAPEPHGDDDALIIFTSGTTGRPKGVVLGQRHLMIDPLAVAAHHGITADTRLMNVLPLHHVNGIIVTLLTPMTAGASVVVNRRFKVGSFWRRLAENRCAIVSVVPTVLQYLTEADDDISRWDLSAFRRFICGAGTLSVAVAERFETRFGLRICHGYGLSETTCYDCFLPVDLTDAEHASWMRDKGYPSIGVPVSANEMAILDPEGRPLGPGERGEICIRGHLVMKYYFKRPDANRSAFAGGWFHSGDEGFYEPDAAGRPFFFITGRIKELINRGGVKLSPFEIEDVLARIPGVNTALAVAFENDWYGEEVGAYVKREPGAALTEDDVIRKAAETLPFSKLPKVVIFGDEIPVTSTGKFQRMKLKHHFEPWRATQFKKPGGGG